MRRHEVLAERVALDAGEHRGLPDEPVRVGVDQVAARRCRPSLVTDRRCLSGMHAAVEDRHPRGDWVGCRPIVQSVQSVTPPGEPGATRSGSSRIRNASVSARLPYSAVAAAAFCRNGTSAAFAGSSSPRV